MLKRSPLRKISQKQIEKNKEKKELTKQQNEFFLSIWNKSPHYCKSCETYLGEECLSTFMDHLLEKSKYPEYRFTEANIFICCLNCHTFKTNGFPKPKHRFAIDRVLQLHLNDEL
jgi:5-methylcytosine-specific restriction endonuclease McrA